MSKAGPHPVPDVIQIARCLSFTPHRIPQILHLPKEIPLIVFSATHIVPQVDHRDSLHFSILHCVSGPTRLAVIYRYHPCRMIHHPFIAPLKALPAISGADETHQISPTQDCRISLLPISWPPLLKPPVRACSNQMDRQAIVSQFKHDLPGPDVYPTGHARYEGLIPIRNRSFDFPPQRLQYGVLCGGQLLWPVSGKAASMPSQFLLTHSAHPL